MTDDLNPLPPAPLPTDLTIAPSTLAYKDRKGWLIAFGVFELLLAAFYGFMAAFMLALPRIAGSTKAQGANPAVFTFASVLYLLLGAIFVAGGIGSILAHRWARIMMLIVGWMWLCFGTLGFVLMVAVMLTQPLLQMGAGERMFFWVFFLGFTGAVMIGIPAILVVFYSRKNVKATCEASNPQAKDQPISIILATLFLGYQALVLLSATVWLPVFSFFAGYVTGFPARFLYVLLGFIWLVLAWYFWHRDIRAWRIVLALTILFAFSNLVTNLFRSPIDLYRAAHLQTVMGVPVTQMKGFAVSKAYRLSAGILISSLFLLLLLYSKRYFQPPSSSRSETPQLPAMPEQPAASELLSP
jgi:hypothetical protein